MTESKQEQAELTAVHFFSWLMGGEAALYVFSFFVSVLLSLCFSLNTMFFIKCSKIYIYYSDCVIIIPRRWYFEEVNQC